MCYVWAGEAMMRSRPSSTGSSAAPSLPRCHKHQHGNVTTRGGDGSSVGKCSRACWIRQPIRTATGVHSLSLYAFELSDAGRICLGAKRVVIDHGAV